MCSSSANDPTEYVIFCEKTQLIHMQNGDRVEVKCAIWSATQGESHASNTSENTVYSDDAIRLCPMYIPWRNLKGRPNNF